MKRVFVALAAVVFFAGSIFADVVTVSKVAKESVTVKDADGKETTYKLTKDTVLEGPRGKIDMDKLKEGAKVEITAKDGTAETIKLKGRVGKGKGANGIQVQPRKINGAQQIQPANIKARRVPAQPNVQPQKPQDDTQ